MKLNYKRELIWEESDPNPPPISFMPPDWKKGINIDLRIKGWLETHEILFPPNSLSGTLLTGEGG